MTFTPVTNNVSNPNDGIVNTKQYHEQHAGLKLQI